MTQKITVQFTQTAMGCADGKTQGHYSRGCQYELDAAFAQTFIDAGQAVPVDADGEIAAGDHNKNGSIDELNEMTAKQLKDFADSKEIDLGKAVKKSDMVKAILEGLAKNQEAPENAATAPDTTAPENGPDQTA